jgi:hypothetical protein
MSAIRNSDRDIKNIVDTSHEEESDVNIKNGIKKGYSDEIISDITGRSVLDVQEVRAKME